jgi:hypothetical protein
MHNLGVTVVVLAPSANQAALQGVFSAILPREPAQHGGVLVWRLN